MIATKIIHFMEVSFFLTASAQRRPCNGGAAAMEMAPGERRPHVDVPWYGISLIRMHVRLTKNIHLCLVSRHIINLFTLSLAAFKHIPLAAKLV